MSMDGHTEGMATGRLLSGKKAWQQFCDLVTGGATAGGGPINPGLAADFKHDPGIYTIEFNIPSLPQDPTAPPNNTGIVNCDAIINWNVEGQQIRRLVTVGNATSISGAGQGVNVQLQDFTTTGAGGPLKYTVVTTCVKGTRPYNSIPPNLFGLGATVLTAGGAGAAVSVPVPPNAGINSVLVTVASLVPGVQPNVIVAHRNAVTVNNVYDPHQYIFFVPLSPLSTIVKIQNLDAANPVTVALTWGIDG